MTTLGATTVTVEFLADKIQENREEKIPLQSSSVKVIGEEGFLSNIFKICFQWLIETDLPESVVVKIPTAGKFGQTMLKIGLGDEEQKFYHDNFNDEMNFQFISLSHNMEIRTYNFMGPKPPIRTPKIYFSQKADVEKEQEGILVMEDFSDKVVMATLEDGLTLEQVLVVVEQLASLHAFSLKQPKGWDRQFMDSGRDRIKMGLTFMQHIANVAQSLPKTHPKHFAKLESKMRQYLGVNQAIKAYASPLWLSMPPVLVHGDVWTCNLLWAKDANGQPTSELLSIIDFQSGHPGNVAEDMARLLATSVSAELRQRHLDTILSHYHEKLCYSLGYEPYSIAQVHRAYEAIQPHTCMMMAFGVQLFINDATIVGEGGAKIEAVQKVLDRAEASLNDFVRSQDNFSFSFVEKLRWCAVRVFMWAWLTFGA